MKKNNLLYIEIFEADTQSAFFNNYAQKLALQISHTNKNIEFKSYNKCKYKNVRFCSNSHLYLLYFQNTLHLLNPNYVEPFSKH